MIEKQKKKNKVSYKIFTTNKLLQKKIDSFYSESTHQKKKNFNWQKSTVLNKLRKNKKKNIFAQLYLNKLKNGNTHYLYNTIVNSLSKLKKNSIIKIVKILNLLKITLKSHKVTIGWNKIIYILSPLHSNNHYYTGIKTLYTNIDQTTTGPIRQKLITEFENTLKLESKTIYKIKSTYQLFRLYQNNTVPKWREKKLPFWIYKQTQHKKKNVNQSKIISKQITNWEKKNKRA